MSLKKIAIIPARAGSKRIPGKNCKLFLGKPIISYTIKTVLDSGIFDEVIVSTDSIEIAKLAEQFGAKVPFLRSAKTSDDVATTSQVLEEVLNKYGEDKVKFDIACCIYPTAVLLKPENLVEGYNKMESGNYDTVVSVLKFGHPIQRGFKEVNGRMEMLWPENKSKRSQDLESVYHDAGQFYFFRPAKFIEQKQLFTGNTGFVLLPEYQAQDIDNEDDWKMAEIKYRYLNG